MAIKESRSDKIFYIIVNIILAIAMIITLYPFVYTLSSSISDPYAVAKGKLYYCLKDFRWNPIKWS